MPDIRTGALIAAAGASSRMGRMKALLPWDGTQTFLERMIRVVTAADLYTVLVTMPEGAPPPELLRALSLAPDVGGRLATPNRYPAQGLTGSVRTALEVLADGEALLVWPIDCPFADAALVRALVDTVGRGALAAVPVVDGNRGHPVVFARPTFELLADADALGGPRAVLQALGDEVHEVPWDDPRVAFDVDTVEDYKNLFGRDLP